MEAPVLSLSMPGERESGVGGGGGGGALLYFLECTAKPVKSFKPNKDDSVKIF